MDKATQLRRLYRAIPKVEGCDPACSGCCGPVPMSATEAAKVRHFNRPIASDTSAFLTPTKAGCLDCAYATSVGCSIYGDRPFMCRLFGASIEHPMLRCPKGAQPKKPLTADQARELTDKYIAIMGAEA